LAEREARATGELRKQVVDHLLGKVPFEVPESLLAQETRSIVYDLVRENTLRGATKEQLEQKKNEIFGFAAQSARERIRASFILDAIARAEKIKVEESEMETRIGELAQRHGLTREKLKAQLAERDAFGEIEEQILVGKTLDFLIASASVKPQAKE
jgi:trigger factor